MTEISIKYYNLAADFMGKKVEKRDLPDRATCLDLVVMLADENERFRKLALNSDGKIGNRLRIFRNGKITFKLDEELAQGDEIIIFPAVSGGSA